MMPFKIPNAADPVPVEYAQLLDEIDQFAEKLDSRFRIPLTNIRFGWDPLVGIVPILGDLAMAAASFHIIRVACQLGAERPLVRKMAVNAAIELVMGMVPLAGPVFDVFYRANVRNVQLLIDEIRRRRALL
jgi:hypothetical protein